MMGRIGPVIILLSSLAGAQEVVVRGLSVYGLDEEENFPVIVRDTTGRAMPPSQYITIQFDVQARETPQLKIRFLHCNRDWKPDNNLLIQDETHNTSFVLDFRTSPGGVEYYSYRYKNHFPDEEDIVRFNYSGNWIFRLMDKEERNVFGEGRFFVVDNTSKVAVTVTNDYRTDAVSPLNQIHKVAVGVRLPREIDGYFYTTVDVFQNRRLHNPFRIDVHDGDPFTTVEGFTMGYRLFTTLNILPGNEYRTLNFGNATQYPHKLLVRPVEGVDQPRMYWRTGRDRDGTASLNSFTGRASDYLDVLFRLDMSPVGSVRYGETEVYVVGPFNEWHPTAEDKLAYDPEENCYCVKKLLRRGVYDYQYITGLWDTAAEEVVQQDWVALEGNDWRTTNTYYTMVYYNDARFGGFDRIVGFGTGKSSGTASSN